MFYYATSFNQPLDNWSVAKVTNMTWMFEGTRAFNQPLNTWDVSSVTVMANMFRGAINFNQNLCDWYNKSCQGKIDFSEMFNDSFCPEQSDPTCDSKSSFCDKCPEASHKSMTSFSPNTGTLILGLSLGMAVVAVVSIVFFLRCKKKNSQNEKYTFVKENNSQNQSEACDTQQDTQKRMYIEVDHTEDDVSTLHDFEFPGEEVFEDKTVGFSTIEFCTLYEKNLHGINMNKIRKSSSAEDQQGEQRDFESANFPEPLVEKCTLIKTESHLCESSTDDRYNVRNCANNSSIFDEGIESDPPFTLPDEKKRNSTSGVFHVIVHAPPGELGLTIIGDSKNGLIQVHRIKFSSPLRSFIQEGDVLESVDDESTAGLTSTQALSLISSRAINSSRTLVFVRDVDESSNPTVEQSFEGDKVIVYAPPGELGLAFDSEAKSRKLIVTIVKPFSPLYGKIQEGDELKYVDGESVVNLTATQAFGLISSRATNSLCPLAFNRNAKSEV